MSQIPARPDCASVLCQKKGFINCTRCRGAAPPTMYCSRRCQRDDWRFHKAYCGKKAYTFELTLVGSSNPVIKRTFDVPVWFTFRQLHYTLQYVMGPWNCTHLHEFTFSKTRLQIGPKSFYEADETVNQFSVTRSTAKEKEEDLLLKDVFDPSGKLYHTVAQAHGEIFPFTYLYDFGDNWRHELIFKGQKVARADRPLFSVAQGRGPVEDCGGISGWNAVKAAFRTPAASRTSEQRSLVKWAKDASGLGSEFSPFKEPDVTQMNYGGRWENHLFHYMEMSGEPLPQMLQDPDDDFGSEESEEEPTEYAISAWHC